MTAPERSRRTAAAAAGLLALTSLLAAAPGLRGSWVHDDVNMVDNPYYDDASDVLDVVRRHSGIYSRTPDAYVGAMTQTYRPFTMLTLVATHVLSPRPLAHHLVGWVLHVLAAWLLWLALRASDRRAETRGVHTLLAGIFLLHPVGVETYVWINGRSDLMAGVCLAALLFACATVRQTSLAHASLIFLLALLGTASKETFAPAALASMFAIAIAPISPALVASRTRRLLLQLVPVVAAVGCYAIARALVLPRNSSSLGGNPFASEVGWFFLPKLGAIASGALLSLRAANMQSLSWDLVRDLSLAEWICGALALLWIARLIAARDLRGLALTGAAAACLAPAVLVAFAIWLGLDRYLYMPLMLVLFVAAPYVARGSQQLTRIVPRVAPLAAAAVLLLAAFNTFVASRAYEDQRAWLAALVRERPEDPSVIVFVAGEVGPSAAGAVLQRLPPPPWPQAVIVPALVRANASGLRDLANRVAEYGVQHYGSNPLIVALALRQRYEAGHRQAALALLPALPAGGPFCREMKKQLGVWAAKENSEERSRLTEAASGLNCQP